MIKILKCKIYIVVLICLLFNSSIYADIKFVDNFKLKGNKVYSSYKDSLYIVNGNDLYEYHDKCLVKIFTNNSGINDVVFNGKFIVIFNINEIFVLNEYDKKFLWKKKIKGRITSNPVITDINLIIDKNSNKLLALDLNTGNLSWKFTADIPNFSFATNSTLLQNQHYLIYVYGDRKVIILNKNVGTHFKTFGLNKKNVVGVHKHNFHIVKAKLYNDVLYLCYDNGSFFLFDLSYGRFIRNGFTNKYKDFLLDKNQIILFNGTNIISYDKFSEKTLWRFQYDKFSNYFYLSQKKILIFYNSFGELCFVNVSNGKIINSTVLKRYCITKILSNNNEDVIWIFYNKDSVALFNIDFL